MKRADGLIVPESATRGPQPIDLIKTYVTYSDLFGYPPYPDYVVEALGGVRRLEFVRACAMVLAAYEKLGASRPEVDRQLADLWFKGTGREIVLGLLSDHSTLVAPQTPLLLMQFALARSPDELADEALTPHALPSLVLAVQEGLGASADDNESNVFTGDPKSALFRMVVASHHFGSGEDEATTIAHHQQRWVGLPRAHAAEPGAVDLYAAFREATGLDKDDFTTVALALWAHCEVHNAYPIPASVVESITMPREAIEMTLSLIARTPDEFRQLVLSTKPEDRTEWSFDTLRRFPLMRLENGDLLVLSKALLMQRIYGWLPMFDLIEGLKTAKRGKDAERAVTWFRRLCELDALEGIASLAGSRLFGEDAIQAAFGTAQSNADAAIEYPDAWVVLEIGTRQLTRATVVATTPEGLEDDLKRGVDEKAKQLDATIRALIADETRLTGEPARPRRRYAAVLVLTEGFPVNPMTNEAIRGRLAAAGLLADPRIGPLHVVDQEELDMAEAIAEDGGPSLLQLLEDHERSNLAKSAFKDWLIVERGRGTGPRRPRRLEGARKEAWKTAVDRLREAAAKPIEDEPDEG
ncbi:MAG: hypothetical protein HYX55_05780 [Chloroflexi bacterium]|nr:hypothetical protein [Chloroflexota bacterium]